MCKTTRLFLWISFESLVHTLCDVCKCIEIRIVNANHQLKANSISVGILTNLESKYFVSPFFMILAYFWNLRFDYGKGWNIYTNTFLLCHNNLSSATISFPFVCWLELVDTLHEDMKGIPDIKCILRSTLSHTLTAKDFPLCA
jgi:hypothetical protein